MASVCKEFGRPTVHLLTCLSIDQSPVVSESGNPGPSYQAMSPFPSARIDNSTLSRPSYPQGPLIPTSHPSLHPEASSNVRNQQSDQYIRMPPKDYREMSMREASPDMTSYNESLALEVCSCHTVSFTVIGVIRTCLPLGCSLCPDPKSRTARKFVPFSG